MAKIDLLNEVRTILTQETLDFAQFYDNLLRFISYEIGKEKT
jgi:hypothetical protein